MERLRAARSRMVKQMAFSLATMALLPLSVRNSPADTGARTLAQRPAHIKQVSEHWAMQRCERLPRPQQH